MTKGKKLQNVPIKKVGLRQPDFFYRLLFKITAYFNDADQRLYDGRIGAGNYRER